MGVLRYGAHGRQMGMDTGSEATSALLGRQRELEARAGLVEDVRASHGWALVGRGEAGVGKTALLNHVVDGSGLRVVRARGVEAEMELAVVGVHQRGISVREVRKGLGSRR